MNNSRTITAYRDLKDILVKAEKPGRYVGGEYGTINRLPEPSDYRVCIVFPDLYEIGMSNQAVRILYKAFNDIPGVHAERAFSPADDFKEMLEERNIPLYSLETGTPLEDFDLIALTVGYELAFTNVLSFFQASRIPLTSDNRSDDHPMVLAGGPAMTNPLPWGSYLDGVFIGEAEGVLNGLTESLKRIKSEGGGRREYSRLFAETPEIWTAASPEAERAMWNGFGREKDIPASLPIPSMAPVQDHGVIEIMRGCPNKCRFCHAGVFYRPYRQKSAKRIIQEADYLVNECGYRDITLSSLSTGDYLGLEKLVDVLNRRFASKKVSFSLPSLRVNSVTLTLIGTLAAVRKSGLTFAVETPTLEGQKGINKEVPADKVIEILNEAKSAGWKLAKFYFMLGLPVENGDDEAQAIIDYLLEVQQATGIKLNVNLGTFIPKAHTPFQRAPQLTDEQAMERIRKIKDGLRSNNKIRFSFHSPYVSFLEGIISRGDSRAGKLAEEAWHNGASFDAWDDRMDKDAWRKAIAAAQWNVEDEICRSRYSDESLPWNSISMALNATHLPQEERRAADSILTVPCAEICTDHCGVCGKENQARDAEQIEEIEAGEFVVDEEPEWRRLLLIFKKDGPAAYLGHLDVMNVFEKALQRSGIRIDFTRGFNPKPRIEFAQPLSLGVDSMGEIGTVRAAWGTESPEDPDDIRERLNATMPGGLEVVGASWIAPVPEGRKVVKVMSAYWGAEWLVTRRFPEGDAENRYATLKEAIEEKCIELGISDDCSISTSSAGVSIRLRHGGTKKHNLMKLLEASLDEPALIAGWDIVRVECLAKGPEGGAVSYTEAFPAK